MLDQSGNFIARSRTQVATSAAAMLILMILAGAGWPQAAPPPSSLDVQEPTQQAAPDRPAPPQGEPAPSPSPPAREESPGLIGKIFEKLPALKSPSETIDDLNARAKDAGDTLSRWPSR
jgi:hypothetical protein